MPELAEIQDVVKLALREDIGAGDLTASLIPVSSQSLATVISRQAAIICGIDWFNEVFRQIDPSIRIDWQVADGDELKIDQILCTLQGSSRSLLTAERSALNFLQTLSGTATTTRDFVARLGGDSQCILLDTRKTLPCLRNAQKYAVTCGGGTNHRRGLYDGILLKENHILAAGSIKTALQQATERYPNMLIEIEVESLSELQQAISAGCRRILLDNMSLCDLSAAVKLSAGRAQLEASGGVNIETVAEIASTGVDFISVGELSKHIQAIDLSMRFLTK
ncbi:MAG: carboxylating nicotinate-nucleotide diphosphorylase [Thiohalomonadales bacterium]